MPLGRVQGAIDHIVDSEPCENEKHRNERAFPEKRVGQRQVSQNVYQLGISLSSNGTVPPLCTYAHEPQLQLAR